MLGHSWPGNVRELENVLTRFIVTGKLTLPFEARPAGETQKGTLPPLKRRLRAQTETEIEAALDQAQGNKRRAADLLGISRAHLYRLLKAQGVR